ncbi:MAG: TetR/AcrR family transcriptional regulator, fatty acid metabolism regulator protein [Verrucomicrobiota bacterium]
MVFAGKGYHDASIEEIAGAAEYGTGTVYLYFKDKEALYLELFEGKIRELIQFIRDRMGAEQQPARALRELIQARMDYFDRNRGFFQIYVREGMNLGWSKHQRWDGVHRLYEEYLDLLTRWIRKGQQQRIFRRNDPRRLAIALSGMMIQLTQDWLKSNEHQPLTEQVEFVFDLFLRGASSP